MHLDSVLGAASRRILLMLALSSGAIFVAPIVGQSDFCFTDVTGARNWRTMAQDFDFPEQAVPGGTATEDVLIYAIVNEQPDASVCSVQLTVLGSSIATEPFLATSESATITAELLAQGLFDPATENVFLFATSSPTFIALGSAVQQRITFAAGAPTTGTLKGASICLGDVTIGAPLTFAATVVDDLSVSNFPKVLITEICADPIGPGGGLDNNLDGTVSATGDEFVEIVNTLDVGINLGGWRIVDAIAVRHVFAAGTQLDPGRAIVVFGGGCVASYNSTASLRGRVGVAASTGSLDLNDAAESVTLVDTLLTAIDSIAYSMAGDGESLVRVPEFPGGTLTPVSTTTPGVLATPGFRNDGVTPYFPGALPTAYPGNGSDCAIEVVVNGFTAAALHGIHAVPGGGSLTLVLDTPGGTLFGRRLLCFGQVHASAVPIPLLVVSANLSVFFLLGLPTPTIADGFDPLVTFPPSLGPYVITTVVPTALAGMSILVNLLVDDPSLPSFGVAEAQDLVIK